MSLDEVEAAMVADACRDGGIPVGDLETIRARVYRGKLEQSDGTRDVFVKLYPTDRAGNVREVLRSDGDVGLPKSRLATADSFAALVMDVAAGRKLSRVMPVAFLPGLWRRYRSTLESAYYNLGRYVGTLHNETHSNRAPPAEERIAHGLERTRILDGLTDETRRRLADNIKAFAEEAVSRAVLHTDPSPHNVFYHDGRVTVIDFAFKRGAAVHDHADVLLGIRLMARRLPYTAGTVEDALETAYWEGYRDTGLEASLDPAAVATFLSLSCLSLLEYYDSDAGTWHSRLTRFTDRSILREELESGVDVNPSVDR